MLSEKGSQKERMVHYSDVQKSSWKPEPGFGVTFKVTEAMGVSEIAQGGNVSEENRTVSRWEG